MPGESAPASHVALAALPILSLDLETTGLDVVQDRVVQIGAAAMLGAKLLDQPRIDQRIDPGVPVPARAAQIHGLTNADLAGAPSFAQFAMHLRQSLAGRVVIGHNIGFDLAVLRHEAARAKVDWPEPRSLDVRMLAGALEPSLPDLSLEAVAAQFGVAAIDRHDALADCLTAARIFAQLLPRLRERDVRTLGEAQSFAARRADLALGQAQAGWHARPGGMGKARRAESPARLDSYIYQRRIDEVMSAPPERIGPGKSLREAAQLMSTRGIGALLVGAPGEPAAGIVTERDLLRALAEQGANAERMLVASVMSTPVETMVGDEMLYRALGRMARRSIRHLCVIDSAGTVVGIISQRDLLRHRAGAAEVLGDALAEAGDAPALAAAFSSMAEVAAGLVFEGASGSEAARVVSSEIRALVARAAALSERDGAAGQGAPAPWCLVVLGSAGRGESLLAADQDHALIHAGTAADGTWFESFGVRIAALLDEAGLPLCKGGVMASKPAWRGTADEWRARIEHWLRRARPEDLLNVDIFFDLAFAAGSSGLARALHDEAVAAAARTPPFLALLAESIASLPPRLGLFGRLPVEDGRVDLKRNGLLPITGIGRTLALRSGSTARSTPDRLRDAAAAGRLAEADAAQLTGIHDELLGWVLRQQLSDLASGLRPSARVDIAALGRPAAARLREHLTRIDEVLLNLQAAVAG